ncbi:MAG: hypothetical protein LPK07_06110, partial [Hymenobacteraceae bacterium]|nr:hypothetical protein [Hymenobacteraceae bacterium]
EEKLRAFQALYKEEKLIPEKLQEVVNTYLYTERKPLREDIVGTLQEKPRILERDKIIERVTKKVLRFVETYITGFSGE